VNDANDMAAALQSLGFQVDKVLNGSLDQMEDAVTRLKNRLSANAGNRFGVPDLGQRGYRYQLQGLL
jgi:hypothetical protein